MNTSQIIESNINMSRFMTIGMKTKLINNIVFATSVAKISENNTIESKFNLYHTDVNGF